MADVHLGEVAYIYALPDPSFYLLLSVVSAALRKASAGKAVSGGHYDRLQNNNNYVVQPLLVYLRHINLPALPVFVNKFRLVFLWLKCQLWVLYVNAWRFRVLNHPPHGFDFRVQIGVYRLYFPALRFAFA